MVDALGEAMAKREDSITAMGVRSLAAVPGKHRVSRGLYLLVDRDGARWYLRYTSPASGKRREMGLGALADVPVAAARRRVDELTTELKTRNVDPVDDRKAKRQERLLQQAKLVTFGKCAEQFIAAHAPGWRNAKHKKQWEATLANEAKLLSSLSVGDIDTALVTEVLAPIWITKTETATRVRQRIEAVLDWATVNKFRSGDNPARWRGHLDKLLPKPTKVKRVQHHIAMPYVDLPAFMVSLRGRGGLSAKLLEFVILTACRVGEAAAARWSEIDITGALWKIPAERMKAGREHSVPLSTAAIKLLSELPRIGDFLFPGSRQREHLNPESARKLLQVDMKHDDVTVHGFRSAFRDWCSERTNVTREVAEAALAHAKKDQTEAAYSRTELIERRRKLMERWSQFLAVSDTDRKVLPMRRITTGAGR